MQLSRRALFLAGLIALTLCIVVTRRPDLLPGLLNFGLIQSLQHSGWPLVFPESIFPALALLALGWVLMGLACWGRAARMDWAEVGPMLPLQWTREFYFWVLGVISFCVCVALMESRGEWITSAAIPWLLMLAWSITFFRRLDLRRGVVLRWGLSGREWLFLLAMSSLGLVYWLHDANSWKYSMIGDEVGFFTRAREMAMRPFSNWDFLEASGEFGEVPQWVTVVQAIFLRIFGANGMSWKASCAAMGMIGLPFLYIYTKRSFGQIAAISASIVYVFSILTTDWAKIGKPHAFMLPSVLMTIAFAALARGGSALYTFLAGFAAGSGFLMWLLGPLVATGYLAVEYSLALILDRDRAAKLRNVTVLFAGWVLGAAPIFAQSDYFSHWFQVSGDYNPWKQVYNTIHTTFSVLYFQGSHHFIFGNISDPVSAVLILVGIGFALRYGYGRILAFLGVGIFFTGTLVPYDYPTVTRLLMLAIPWAILAGIGVNWIATFLLRPGKFRGFVLAGLYVVIFGLNYKVFWSESGRVITAFNQYVVRYAQAHSPQLEILWILPWHWNANIERVVLAHVAPNVKAAQDRDALVPLQQAVARAAQTRMLAVFLTPGSALPPEARTLLLQEGVTTYLVEGGEVSRLPIDPNPISRKVLESWATSTEPGLGVEALRAMEMETSGQIPMPSAPGEPAPPVAVASAVPLRVALGKEGRKFILFEGGSTVRLYAPDGTSSELKNSKGEVVQFQQPSDLTVGPDGRLYVMDAVNYIYGFSPEGVLEREILLQMGVFSPRGLDVNPENRFILADTGQGRVLVCDSTPHIIGELGSPGKSEGQLADPIDVVMDGKGRVVVVDGGNGRIQRFNLDGTLDKAWPHRFVNASLMTAHLIRDSAGTVWVMGGESPEIWQLPNAAGGDPIIHPAPPSRIISGTAGKEPGQLFLVSKASDQLIEVHLETAP